MKLEETNISLIQFMAILFLYFLAFGFCGWIARGHIDGKKYTKGYIDGQQARIDYEHGVVIENSTPSDLETLFFKK